MGEDAIEMLNKLENTIQRLEKEYGGRLIKEEELTYMFPELSRWLNSIVADFEKETLIFYHKEDKRIIVKIFTERNSYSISARRKSKRNKEDLGYLGCTVYSRIPLVGETWARGKDLSDGTYTEQTWINILCDIVSYEIKPLEIEI